LLTPFWNDMATSERFLHHTEAYLTYWNTARAHSGIGMHDMTPKEKLVSLGIMWVNRILDFPTLILDDSFLILQEHLNYFQWQLRLKQTDLKLLQHDQKTRIDLISCYPHLQGYAQNVFAYYLTCEFRAYLQGTVIQISTRKSSLPDLFLDSCA
jgi:hypothetical protein